MDRTLLTRSTATKRSILSSRYIFYFFVTGNICCLVLVAHNGFAFDFLFLVAEVKRRKLDEIFSRADLYYTDTLHDARRVSGTHLCNM